MELHLDGKLTVSLVHASPGLVFIYGSENDFNQDWKIENTEGSSPDEIESIGPDSKEDAN